MANFCRGQPTKKERATPRRPVQQQRWLYGLCHRAAVGWGVAQRRPMRTQFEDGRFQVRNVGEHTGAHHRISRRHARPRYTSTSRPSRAWGMPGARCTRSPCARKSAHGSHHRSTGNTRHSRTRLVLTAYIALSPATNSSCHRRRRIEGIAKPGWARKTSAGLTPATGARTTRFCRPRPVFTKRLRRHVHVRRSIGKAGSSAVRLRARRSLTSRSLPCDPKRARRCRVHRIPSQRS
jgi:hypothetical protein